MKTFSYTLFFAFLINIGSMNAQDNTLDFPDTGGVYALVKNDAAHPCITPEQYQILHQRCEATILSLRLAKTINNRAPVLLSWPLQAASGFTDCGYYAISSYVDQNIASGSFSDYNCGTNTYDGHHGTDIATGPFPFYKMDHHQVEVIAAADGILLDKADGNFDRNCSSNSLPANYAVILHADGTRALYWHLKSGSVTTKNIGQPVNAGEYLGIVGSSGNSTGPHLHFEVKNAATTPTYEDPYAGSCNILNANSWWASQKPYTEPSILKTSVHITDINLPPCPMTEEPNESTSFTIPFQGPGLAPGYAKFYISMRDIPVGTTVALKILNPDGTTFNSWNYTPSMDYTFSYWGWSKKLPTTEGAYTFKATYNNVSCSQVFDIHEVTGIASNTESQLLHVSPNPATDAITIQGESVPNGTYKLNLKNITGQVVLTDQMSIENNTMFKSLSIAQLPGGPYFLTIETEKSRVVKMVIKQN